MNLRVSEGLVTLKRSLKATFLLGLIACIYGSCEPAAPNPTLGSRKFSYRLLLNFPPADSVQSTHRDALDTTLIDIATRIQTGTVIHAVWSEWADTTVTHALSDGLRKHENALLHLLVPQAATDQPQDQQFGAALGKQVAITPLGVPTGTQLQPRKNRCNFMLFRNLAPSAVDDGAYAILFSDGPFCPSPGKNRISEAVWLTGDSILYERFLSFWQAMATDDMALRGAQCHTYSNLHDHLAWFFPDQSTQHAGIDILDQLRKGAIETRQPVKLRLAITQLDVCHAPFATALVDLQSLQQVDVKLIIRDDDGIDARALDVLSQLQAGSLRFLNETRDSVHHLAMQSNFITIDGPYPLESADYAEPRRLIFILAEPLNLPQMHDEWGAWLRIVDRDMHDALEDHFDALWEMASDTTQLQRRAARHRPDCDW